MRKMWEYFVRKANESDWEPCQSLSPQSVINRTDIRANMAVVSNAAESRALPNLRIGLIEGTQYPKRCSMSPAVLISEQYPIAISVFLLRPCVSHRLGRPESDSWAAPWVTWYCDLLLPCLYGLTVRCSPLASRQEVHQDVIVHGLSKPVSAKINCVHCKQWGQNTKTLMT